MHFPFVPPVLQVLLTQNRTGVHRHIPDHPVNTPVVCTPAEHTYSYVLAQCVHARGQRIRGAEGNTVSCVFPWTSSVFRAYLQGSLQTPVPGLTEGVEMT